MLVFSENANESRQVINEVSLAYNQGKTIIPFKIANTPMNDDFDYFLNRVHWLDAVTQPLEESITAMRKYVENILGYTASLDETAESASEKEQKWMLPAGIGVALVVIVIVIAVALSHKDRGNQNQVADGGASSDRITEESQIVVSEASESIASESSSAMEEIVVASSDSGTKTEEVSSSQAKDEMKSETKIESLERGTFDYLSVNNLSQGGYATYGSANDMIFYYWPGKGVIWRDSEGMEFSSTN